MTRKTKTGGKRPHFDAIDLEVLWSGLVTVVDEAA